MIIKEQAANIGRIESLPLSCVSKIDLLPTQSQHDFTFDQKVKTMAEKATRIKLTLLTGIRITCQTCGVTTELEIAKLPQVATGQGDCIHCGKKLFESSEMVAIKQFPTATKELQQSKLALIELLVSDFNEHEFSQLPKK